MRNEKVNHFRFMIFIICTGLFIVMILLLNSEILRRFDIMIITRVQDMISTPLTTALLFITFLGSVKGVVFITIICSITVFYLRNYLLGLYLIISVALGAGAFNRLLKLIFLRDRPEILKLVNESGFSFPGRHAMGSIILFGGLVFILYRLYGWNRSTMAGMLLCAILVGLIGLSRIYLGAHYPSDVLAGYAAGSIWLIVSVNVYDALERNSKKISKVVEKNKKPVTMLCKRLAYSRSFKDKPILQSRFAKQLEKEFAHILAF